MTQKTAPAAKFEIDPVELSVGIAVAATGLTAPPGTCSEWLKAEIIKNASQRHYDVHVDMARCAADYFVEIFNSGSKFFDAKSGATSINLAIELNELAGRFAGILEPSLGLSPKDHFDAVHDETKAMLFQTAQFAIQYIRQQMATSSALTEAPTSPREIH